MLREHGERVSNLNEHNLSMCTIPRPPPPLCGFGDMYFKQLPMTNEKKENILPPCFIILTFHLSG